MPPRVVKLGEISEINPRFSKETRPSDNSKVTFVPMAAVDEVMGRIISPQIRDFGEVSKGFTLFRERDVLFAKITPCMENGKAAIAENLCNGLGSGSTEFHVLRPSEKVLSEWLYYFVRQPRFRAQAKKAFTGSAGQQRVPADFVKEAEIPLPPLSEQRRLVDILFRAEGIMRLQQQAADKAREIIPALFLDMFGDPATNPKGWPMQLFGETGKLDRGLSKHRPRDAKELYGGPYPFIQTGDVANSGGQVTEFRQTYSEIGLKQSRLWPSGTLCITIAANIARTAVLTFDACFPDSIVGFQPGKNVCNEYIQSWLSFLQPTLEAFAPQAAQKNINLQILRSLPVPIPSIVLQREFAAREIAVTVILQQRRAAEETGNELFQSLLRRAFSGGL